MYIENGIEITVITGGAGHIGLEITEQIECRGGFVVIVDKNTKSLENADNFLNSRGLTSHICIECDLLLEESFEKLLTRISSELGRINHLVKLTQEREYKI